MKCYDLNKKLSHLMYWDKNNLQRQVVSQKLPVDDFTWVKNAPYSKESWNYNENNYLPFLLKRKKIEKREKILCVSYMIKINMMYI